MESPVDLTMLICGPISSTPLIDEVLENMFPAKILSEGVIITQELDNLVLRLKADSGSSGRVRVPREERVRDQRHRPLTI